MHCQSCGSKVWLRCHKWAATATVPPLHEKVASPHNSTGTAAACQHGCDSVMMPSRSNTRACKFITLSK